jgi:hypothetical protein
VKLRSSPHSKDLRAYEITHNGVMVLGGAIRGYEGILTGAPNKIPAPYTRLRGQNENRRRRPRS